MKNPTIVHPHSLPRSLRYESPDQALCEALDLADFLQEVALSMAEGSMDKGKGATGLALIVPLLRDKISIAAGCPAFPLAAPDGVDAPELQTLLMAGLETLQKSGKGGRQ